MRTQQQNPQPRSNQVSRSTGGLRNASPYLWNSLFFHEGNAQESRGVPATGNGLKGHEPQVYFCTGETPPSSWSQAATPNAPQVCDRCVCSLPAQPRTFCAEHTACTALVSWGRPVLSVPPAPPPITVNVFKGAQIKLLLKFQIIQACMWQWLCLQSVLKETS